MPEVDWTPDEFSIRMYQESDWSFIGQGGLGVRADGAKYVTYPLHIKRIYGTVRYTPPKRTFRQRIRAVLARLAWKIIQWDERM
jgi:hypothetical protein